MLSRPPSIRTRQGVYASYLYNMLERGENGVSFYSKEGILRFCGMLGHDGVPTQGGGVLLSMWSVLSSEESSSRYRAFKKAEKEREKAAKERDAKKGQSVPRKVPRKRLRRR